MKVLYIHQYFRTPDEGGCVRSYNLAKGLVAAGHDVTMITAHNERQGQQNIDGIKVHYLRVRYANQFGFIKRIIAYLRFVNLAKQKIAEISSPKKRFDLAYVMTTPLTTGLIALHVKEVYNLPYYFEVGDLWPEAPIKMGAIKNNLIKRVLYKFEKKCYFEAQRVVALSPAIRNYIEATCPDTNVYVLTNISDTKLFEPTLKIQTFSKENPLKLAYIGAFGAANSLDYLVSAAKICQERGIPVHFSMMGDGRDFKKIQRVAKKLPNMTVYPFGNIYKVRDLLEQQDAVYVSFKNLEILNTGSPNKFFDGLAAGKLIIVNFGGWVRSLIEKNKCGFHHDPLSPEEFARKINVFIKEPDLLYKYQKNSRKMAEKYYDIDLQVMKLQKILNNEKHLGISDSEVYILTA